VEVELPDPDTGILLPLVALPPALELLEGPLLEPGRLAPEVPVAGPPDSGWRAFSNGSRAPG